MNTKELFGRHLVVAILAAAPFVTAGAAELDRSPARVTQAAAGKPLTAASRATPETIVAGYLRSRGRAPEVLSSLRTTGKSTGANRVTHLRMEQVVDGLKVQGAYVKAAINSRGELVHVIDRTVAVSNAVPSRINAGQAVRAAMAAVHPTKTSLVLSPAGKKGNTSLFNGGAYFHRAPRATAVLLPMVGGQSARGWLVETWTQRTNELHHTTVDGSGRVLDIESRTATDSYNVFLEDPGKDAQTVVAGPGAGNDESPVGWLGSGSQSTINIAGNNVNAYLDTIENGQPDRGGTPVTTGDFLADADLAVEPTAAHNNEVSVQNLFYLNNAIHDILYRHGFDEAAGNFQIDNFGNGGVGDDPVRAEAQDGGGTNNANFATPPDGSRPRMQMYLWTGAGGTHEVVVNSPVAVSYGASPAAFGPQLDTTGITGDVVVAVPADGCAAITSPVAGGIALIDRGACDFSLKVFNAQRAGATAVIVANNQGGTATITMGAGAKAQQVRIPAVMISQNDGTDLKAIPSPNATARRLAVLPLQIDSALDSDVVYHEYGHGLSWRMIGHMSGPIAGAIGEGNSDGIAMLVNGDDVVGEYSASSPGGIRRAPYAGYPLTYGTVGGADGQVHNDGEIYAAIVWRMMELFGSRRDELFSYVIDGMNFTPSKPAYENMRDGILASVANGSTPSDCSLVWQAFAQFGVGVGARGDLTGKVVTITESFDVPANCSSP
ncbi:MAG TPA: M36 family metallopeptidase [Gemmatimonadaceae bacterium]|nr:M36 family metallopeptidase [Gemmatimonadaceae bacterium]